MYLGGISKSFEKKSLKHVHIEFALRFSGSFPNWLHPPLLSSIGFALVEVSRGSGEVEPSDCTVLDMTRSAALLCVISTKHKLDKLSRRQIAQQFIVADERRRNMFGCFT